MKHLFTVLILVAISATANAQWWFDAGVKGSIGPTLLFDDNAFDSGLYKHKFSGGNSIGGRLGFNYGYHVGLSLEYASATSKQNFDYDSDPFNLFRVKHNDIIAVFRYSGNGAYVEIGGKRSGIREVEVENLESDPFDQTALFEDSYTSAIFGFGSYLAGDDLISLNIGLRFHWAFGDVVNAEGKTQRVPFYNVPPTETYDPAGKTSLAAAQLQLELNYAFGRFAKTACSDRWKLILFR